MALPHNNVPILGSETGMHGMVGGRLLLVFILLIIARTACFAVLIKNKGNQTRTRSDDVDKRDDIFLFSNDAKLATDLESHTIEFPEKQQAIGHGDNLLVMNDRERKNIDGLPALQSEDDVKEYEQPGGHAPDDICQDSDDEMFINNPIQTEFTYIRKCMFKTILVLLLVVLGMLFTFFHLFFKVVHNNLKMKSTVAGVL